MTNTGQPIVYILVLNYCSLDDTIACVESIRGINYPNCHLLVIDNMSPDGSGKALKKRIPSTEFLELPVNQGYAGGNNVGIRIALEAGADYVFIVNPDVRLPPDCLGAYVDDFENNPGTGALNPVQLAEDGITIDRRFSWTIWPNAACPWPADGPSLWESKSLLGAAIMVKREALMKTGLFDPLYFAYGEEQDFCRRLRFHGYKLAVTSRSPIIHLRTHENRGSDDWRLFLRLKGVYLLDLKDVTQPFFKCLKNVARTYLRDITSRKSHYAHNFRTKHYLKVGLWLVMHLPAIARHRNLDKAGGAYLLAHPKHLP